jgi:iron complex outermembrane recepter protein
MRAGRSSARNRQLPFGCALVCVAVSAGAQDDAAPVVKLARVEVTGSNIARTEIETALPVQVLTREDIERSGSATVAELMSKVSANVLGHSDQLSIDSGTPGLSSVNLRGLGSGNTLVLLNGRRIANYAFDGAAVDVNSIPLAAVDRVEILKDGASAIYGADAVAGVVNFILRKNFTGLELTGFGSWPTQGGGQQFQASVSAGLGDLERDKYNLFVTATWQKDSALDAVDRPFSRTGYLPERGVIQLSPQTFPANIFALTFPNGPDEPSEGRLFNPTFASGCAPPYSLPSTVAGTPGDACGFDNVAYGMTIPQSERSAVYGRGTLRPGTDLELFAELAYASTRLTIGKSPTPVAANTYPNGEPIRYPVGGPYYPTAFADANGLGGDLNLLYRTLPLGRRVNQVDTSAWRAVVGADGVVAGWDYGTALSYSRNDQNDSMKSGYVSVQRMREAMATGLVNPFGASGPEGNALLAGTQITGETHSGRGTTLDLLATASRQGIALPGGPLAFAVGAELRREQLDNDFAPVMTQGDVFGVTVAVQPVSGSRTAQALFAEVSAPFAEGVEAQLAARYDHYSDFGSTVNPKVALRWQPLSNLLLRTSWGTGFRAPPLYDLYAPQMSTSVDDVKDSMRCPITNPPTDCPESSYPAVVGGNPNLQPETSRQFNAGLVWEPASGLSFTVDYWQIRKSNLIGMLQPETVFADLDRYGPTNIVRGPVDPNHPELPGPIETVILTQQNLGNLQTAGIDVNVAWRGPASAIGRFGFTLNGTYVTEWKLQPDGLNYESAVGRIAPGVWGPLPRWKHYAALNWTLGPWGATLGQTYQSGYEDANIFPPRVRPQYAVPRQVASYSVWDVQARYSGWRDTVIVLGVKNLFDRDPPFTNQPYTTQVGYDPNYADPRGRTIYAQLTLAFN